MISEHSGRWLVLRLLDVGFDCMINCNIIIDRPKQCQWLYSWVASQHLQQEVLSFCMKLFHKFTIACFSEKSWIHVCSGWFWWSFPISLLVNKSHEKTKTNNELILQTSLICVAKAWRILFLCDIELHCYSKTIKSTPVNTPFQHRHCTLCSVNPT